HYFIHVVNFSPDNPVPVPMNAPRMTMMASSGKAEMAPSVTISDKVEITAQVLFAAKVPLDTVTKTTP
ncbi:MAG: hypothetical protein M3R00_05085, partial [Pseudomonadota bacterium]|nr:hypothetical protein [Pseudomonadota bacterium]